jgi:tetratricopeptide (TPR) repeat protein
MPMGGHWWQTAGVADEWFRSPDWEPADQAEFERRLGRARRAGRGQYLRIKGLALCAAGHIDGARSLWLRVLDDPGYEIERWATLEHLADLAFDDDPEQAEKLYRQLLSEDPSLNATTQMAEVRLAELLTRDGTVESLREAGELLDAWQSNRKSPFPINHFRRELARARWGEAIGKPDVVRDSARHALAFTDAKSPFPRHPDAGVVHAEPNELNWLRARTQS